MVIEEVEIVINNQVHIPTNLYKINNNRICNNFNNSSNRLVKVMKMVDQRTQLLIQGFLLENYQIKYINQIYKIYFLLMEN